MVRVKNKTQIPISEKTKDDLEKMTEQRDELLLEIKKEQNTTPTKEFFDSMSAFDADKKEIFKSKKLKFMGRQKKIKRAKQTVGENTIERSQKCQRIGRPRLSQCVGKKVEKEENANNNSLRSKRTKKIKAIFDPSIFKQKRKRIESDKSLDKATTERHNKKKVSVMSRSSDKMSRSTETQIFKVKHNIAECCYVCLEFNAMELDKCCQNCRIKAHRKCLENQQSGAVVKVLDKDWLCPACLLCCCCGENVNYGTLVVCTSCKLAYHKSCHRPVLENKLIVADIWKCDSCSDSRYQQDNRLKSYSVRKNEWSYNGLVVEAEFDGFSEMESQPDFLKRTSASNSSAKKPKNAFKNDSSSPDSDSEDSYSKEQAEKLRNWNCQDVYQYFSEYFPANQSEIFKEQEIDGSSLLLMRRSDVLKGFKHLKLGPAINIYRHIVMLQTGSDDPRQTWN